MSEHHEFQQLAGAYALGALDAADCEAFERHLPLCAECRAEVADARAVAMELGQMLTPVAPPPALRARVLAAASVEPRHKPAAPRAWAPLIAIAATLVAVVAVGSVWNTRRALDVAQRDARAASEQVALLRAEMGELQSQTATARRVVDLLTAPNLLRVVLKGQSTAPSAAGQAFWSVDRGLMFAAANLPALPSGRVYQLWYVTERAPISAGLVTADPSGRYTLTAPPLAGVQPTAFAVTVEPEGGVAAPTGPMVLLGTV